MKVMSLVQQSHRYPGRIISKDRPRFVLMVLLSLLVLACGPFVRLNQIIGASDPPASKVTVTANSSPVIAEAYAKIDMLPGYRLERHYSERDDSGQYRHYRLLGEVDAGGNKHVVIQAADETPAEYYFVGGRTFAFEKKYEAWIDLGATAPAETQPDHKLLQNPAQLLAQFDVEPTQATQATLNSRVATRYALQRVITEMTTAFEQEASELAVNMSGALWIDNDTGALLKSEIILYDRETGRPQQEFRLAIRDIGNIAAIAKPTPVVDPMIAAAATATAQAWTVLTVEINYRGSPLSFELIPLQARQIPNSSPRSAEVHLILRQMPGYMLQEMNLEPFLAQLRQQLTLSIPERNLIVTSSGYHLENKDAAEVTVEVSYFFNADLEELDRVELIVAGPGNPQFVPVPVE